MSILFDDMPLTRLALGLQLALKDLSDNYGDLGQTLRRSVKYVALVSA
jgi:hypothetical protein